jgi:hypothetical protein
MKKCWAAVVLVLAAEVAVAGTGKISGSVVDQSGMPVKQMTVEAWPLGEGVMGGVPQALTDENGHFVISVWVGRFKDGTPYGLRWSVYVYQERDYYPDLGSRFYATASSHGEIVNLTPEAPEATVQLKLGPKAGALTGKVTDAVTGAPVNPHFEFAWASDPANRRGHATKAEYRILLPSNTDIKVTVSSRGYKPWTYPGVINLGPGQDMTLNIQLQPAQ